MGSFKSMRPHCLLAYRRRVRKKDQGTRVISVSFDSVRSAMSVVKCSAGYLMEVISSKSEVLAKAG